MAVNAIGTQLCDPINSGLTRWRLAVKYIHVYVYITYTMVGVMINRVRSILLVVS